MFIQMGSYLGNGVDDRVIGGIRFAPIMVWIVNHDDGRITWRTSAMAASLSSSFGSGDSDNLTGIKNLRFRDGDGFASFVLGTHSNVNTLDTRYHWIAFSDNSLAISVGTYSGDGVDNRNITGMLFRPLHVFVQEVATGGTNHNGVQHWNIQLALGLGADDNTYDFMNGTNAYTNGIQTTGDGFFQVGTDVRVNRSGGKYYYVAFNEVSRVIHSNSWTGNATDNRTIIVGSGADNMTPDWVMCRHNDPGAPPGNAPAYRHKSLTGDASWSPGGGPVANKIQAFVATGFEIGTDVSVNELDAGADGYQSLAFRDNSADSLVIPFTERFFTGAFFQLQNNPYTLFKSSLALHDKLTKARLV